MPSMCAHLYPLSQPFCDFFPEVVHYLEVSGLTVGRGDFACHRDRPSGSQSPNRTISLTSFGVFIEDLISSRWWVIHRRERGIGSR